MAERVLNIEAPRGSMWVTTSKSVSIANWPIAETTVNFGDLTGPDNGFVTTKLVGTAKAPSTASVTFVLRERMFSRDPFVTKYLNVANGVLFDYEDATSMTDLLSAIQAMSITLDNIKVSTDKVTDVQTKVTAIDTLTRHSTNGLAAIKTEITSVKTATTAIKTVIDAINILINHATNGLPAIKTAINGVKTDTGSIITKVDSATNGLPAIKTAINGVKTDTSSIITKVDNVSATQPDNSEIRELLRVVNSRLGILRYILNGTQFPG